MNTNCATSSRDVIFFIQRRTVGDALIGEGFGGAGRRDAPFAANASAVQRSMANRVRTTFPV